ncbi:SET domain-containing protein-lysine N-methyltransferase [Kineococcus sp. NBC_00420]|uniref:SET domain-containing protein n=1 Tax=unclassified Kineococcus TaxID=2621656 RepID=UPI002E23FF26
MPLSPPGPDCRLTPLARVDRSPIEGVGLFATGPLRAGTVVSRFGGRLVSDAEQHRLFADAARSGTYVDTLSVGADLNLVLPPDAPQRAGNHSCDPNTWWVDPYTVVARRDVTAGEELTLDYATITDDPDFAMSCSCRALSCRGRVTGRDWRLPTLQVGYGPHWVPILRERIAGSRRPRLDGAAGPG